MLITTRAAALAPRRSTPRADYAPLWNLAPWQPPGATPAARDDALWRMACSLRAPSQTRSRRLDRELANAALPSGYGYFGQLVAHDVSWHDPARRNPVEALEPVNRRARKLALEALYDGGPQQAPELFERHDPALLRLTARRSPTGSAVYFDLAREGGRALVADPRQEQNAIIAQVHVALARGNNALAGALRLREPALDALDVHSRARRWLVACYQHVLFREWLPRVLHPEAARELDAAISAAHRSDARSSPLFGSGPAHVSAEFAFAALRFGHSMVREQYRMRPEGYLYDMTPASEAPGWIERGGPFLMLSRPLPAPFAVDWRMFVENGEVEPNRARKIGPRVAWSLGNLPRTASEPPQRANLPYLTLRASSVSPMQLVSGATAARALGLEVVGDDDLPLWCYVLREAEAQCGGEHLGRLGSTIVGETFVGLLAQQESACLVRHPSWIPPLGESASRFTLRDLLTLGERTDGWIAERLEGSTPGAE